MDYKEKVIKRQECNREIIKRINKLVEEHKDLRFVQILWCLGLPYCDLINDELNDRFVEESVDTLEKMDKYWKNYE